MSCPTRSNNVHRDISRTSSLIRVAFPRARRAAKPASSSEKPLFRCSATSSSRSERSSRSKSRSRSLRRHQRISLLLGRPHHPGDCARHLFPFRLFSGELFLARRRTPVVFEFAFLVLG